MIMGIAGLPVAATFYILDRHPRQVTLTPQEDKYLTDAEGGAQPRPVTIRDRQKVIPVPGLLGGYFCFLAVRSTRFGSTAPGCRAIREMDRHISIAWTGWITAISFRSASRGSILGGRLATCSWSAASTINSRKYPMAISLIGTAIFTPCSRR